MLQQHESDVLTMMQEASQWDFAGESPEHFLNGYMTALRKRRSYQYSDMLMWACALIQKGEAPGVNDEIKDAVVQMWKEEGRPAEAPRIHASCPADPSHHEFKTVVTVMQDWKVSSHGAFIEDVANVQVIMGPNTGQEWVCAICGETADVVNI